MLYKEVHPPRSAAKASPQTEPPWTGGFSKTRGDPASTGWGRIEEDPASSDAWRPTEEGLCH